MLRAKRSSVPPFPSQTIPCQLSACYGREVPRAARAPVPRTISMCTVCTHTTVYGRAALTRINPPLAWRRCPYKLRLYNKKCLWRADVVGSCAWGVRDNFDEPRPGRTQRHATGTRTSTGEEPASPESVRPPHHPTQAPPPASSRRPGPGSRPEPEPARGIRTPCKVTPALRTSLMANPRI